MAPDLLGQTVQWAGDIQRMQSSQPPPAKPPSDLWSSRVLGVIVRASLGEHMFEQGIRWRCVAPSAARPLARSAG